MWLLLIRQYRCYFFHGFLVFMFMWTDSYLGCRHTYSNFKGLIEATEYFWPHNYRLWSFMAKIVMCFWLLIFHFVIWVFPGEPFCLLPEKILNSEHRNSIRLFDSSSSIFMSSLPLLFEIFMPFYHFYYELATSVHSLINAIIYFYQIRNVKHHNHPIV